MHALNTPSPVVASAQPRGRLLTEQEAADFLAVAVRTLQDKRVRGGGCPYVKIGRLVRYRMEDLTAFIEAGRRSHTSEGR